MCLDFDLVTYINIKTHINKYFYANPIFTMLYMLMIAEMTD